MQAGPLQSYLDKWLAACPWQRQALVFVDAGRYPGHLALAALEFELLSCVHRIREPTVAAAKLHWWLDELSAAPETGGRHPLTELLFDQPQAARLPADYWTAPVLAALQQLEQPTPADFTAQLEAARMLHAPLARLETGWWFGLQADFGRAATLAACSQLLLQLGQLEDSREREQLPLPMQRLARHGLSRQALTRDTPARRLAVREQAGDLWQAGRQAGREDAPLSVFRSLQSSVETRLLSRLRKDGEIAVIVAASSMPPRLRTLHQAWQAARAWRRAAG